MKEEDIYCIRAGSLSHSPNSAIETMSTVTRCSQESSEGKRKSQPRATPTSSSLTLRNVQLKVVGRELVQPLLELRGSGWFRFRLWCLRGRRKTIISGFVLQDAVEAWRRTRPCSEDSKNVYLSPTLYLTPVLNKARQDVTPTKNSGYFSTRPRAVVSTPNSTKQMNQLKKSAHPGNHAPFLGLT